MSKTIRFHTDRVRIRKSARKALNRKSRRSWLLEVREDLA